MAHKFNHKSRILTENRILPNAILPGTVIQFNYNQTGVYDKKPLLFVIKKGSDKDLGMFFRAIKEFDGYQADVGIKSTKELEIKTMLQRRLFRDALEESTSFGLDPINFNDFARYIRRFQGQYPKKLDILLINFL